MGTSVLTGMAGQLGLVVSGVLSARSLAVAERGHLALLTVVPIVIVQAGTLGIPLALTYSIATHPAGVGTLVRSLTAPILWLYLMLTTVGLVLGYALGRGSGFAGAAVVAALFIPPAAALQFGLAVLQGLRRYNAFNVFRLLPGLLYAAFVTVLFVARAAGVWTLLLAWVVAMAMPAVAIWVHLRGRLEWSTERDEHTTLGQLVRFGSRALIGNLAPLESLGMDLLIAGLILPPAALGLYVVGWALCNLVRFVAQSIGFVAYPHVASLPARDRWPAIVKFVGLSVALIGAVVMLLELGAAFIVPFFFGARYGDAVPVARVLLIASYLFAVRRVLIDSLRGAGRTADGTAAESLALLLFLALVVWPARAASAVDVALALTVAAAVSLMGLVILSWLRARSPSGRSVEAEAAGEVASA